MNRVDATVRPPAKVVVLCRAGSSTAVSDARSTLTRTRSDHSDIDVMTDLRDLPRSSVTTPHGERIDLTCRDPEITDSRTDSLTVHACR